MKQEHPQQQLPWIHSAEHPLFDLAYADDTIIMARAAQTVQAALHHIQRIATQSNLKLNLKKCELLRQNATQNIHFIDGTQVQNKTQAKYLGVILRDDGKTHTDVRSRVAKAREGFKQLHKFWRHTNINKQWKLRVYRAIFIPMITNGMESAALTETSKKQLNAFHHSSLRKIFNIKSTFYTKVLDTTKPTVTNEQVLKRAHTAPLSDYILSQQLKLFGHVLRAGQETIEHSVCFTKQMVYRADRTVKMRQGGPTLHWLEELAAEVWCLLPLVSITVPHNPLQMPYSFLFMKQVALNRSVWQTLTVLPTGSWELP